MTVNYPKSWNDLSGKQLLAILKIWLGGFSTHAQKILLLKTVIGVRLRTLARQDPETVARCYYVLEPFLKSEITLTKNLLPWLRLHYWYHMPFKVYGPAELLKNLTFLEFVFADSYYFQLVTKKGNPDALNKLLAVLYRPKRKKDLPGSLTYKGDIRQDFNEHLISGQAEYFRDLDMVKKQAVLLYYKGCRSALEKMYPYVFDSDNQSKAKSSGWSKVLIDMAGEKFGTIEQTGKENLHTVLLHMNSLIKENQQLIETAKK